MKKYISLILTVITVLSVSSCSSEEGKSRELPLPELDESTSDVMDMAEEIHHTDSEEKKDIPAAAGEVKRCYYGEKTGTDKTYTGLEPLPENKFEKADIVPGTVKPKEAISHSFGVSANGRPHEISISNQKFFDDNGYDAICYDSKRAEQKVIYLTFDCGYENGYTAKILDVLKVEKVKAVFFCTLAEVKSNPEIIARMINEGHIVGNHSVTHPDFSALSREKMLDEVKGFDDYMRENFGYSSLFFRYPQGKYNEDSLDFLNSIGYKCIFWSLAYADWDLNNQKGADYAVKTVTERLHPGAVILLHAVSPDNAEGLAAIIDTARELGYIFGDPEKL